MEYAVKLRQYLSLHANQRNALPMEKYLKDKFTLFGIKSPERNWILKQFLAENGLPEDQDFEATISSIWCMQERELHYCAIQIFDKKKWYKQLDSIEIIEHMITHQSWWDSVDLIASTLCGQYFKQHPNQIKTIIPKWNQSENMWLVRSSILFQLKYKEETNMELLIALIKPHLDSSEFFIQKAIGWALRQSSCYYKTAVASFVAHHELKPVSKREAIKYI